MTKQQLICLLIDISNCITTSDYYLLIVTCLFANSKNVNSIPLKMYCCYKLSYQTLSEISINKQQICKLQTGEVNNLTKPNGRPYKLTDRIENKCHNSDVRLFGYFSKTSRHEILTRQ